MSEDAAAAFFHQLSHSFIPHPAVESSSLPFGQSLSPSHSQCRGTQAWEPWQLNMSAAQVMAPETHRKKKNAIKVTHSMSAEKDHHLHFLYRQEGKQKNVTDKEEPVAIWNCQLLSFLYGWFPLKMHSFSIASILCLKAWQKIIRILSPCKVWQSHIREMSLNCEKNEIKLKRTDL